MGKKPEKSVGELLREARRKKRREPLETPDWTEGLRALTWADLEDWAGDRVLDRGKSYKGRGKDVAKVGPNSALAWVTGTRKYVTQIGLDLDTGLFSVCTCPYGGEPCKHAVAVLLVCMEAIQAGKVLPEASSDDPRFELIGRAAQDDGDEEADDHERDPAPGLRESLAAMKKDQIVDLVIQVARDYPEFGEALADRMKISSGPPKDAARELRRQIQGLADFEPHYDDCWGDGCVEPDFRKVRSGMRALLDKGQADQVVSLGTELWEASSNLIESLDQEGEIGEEVRECMEVVFDALHSSSMPRQDRLGWMIHRFLEDEYGALPDYEKALETGGFSKEDWSHAAGVLRKRLSAMPVPSGEESFHLSHQRSEVLSWILRSLEESGEGGIIEVLEREAPLNPREHSRLVEVLKAAGQMERARQWAIRGFESTWKGSSGISWSMAEKLQGLAQGSGNLPQAAALAAMKFFTRPDADNYLEVEKAADKAGLWPAVREGLLDFLETGKRPDLREAKAGAVAWPLPKPWVCFPGEKVRARDFPDHGTLTDVAVHEKRHDDAIAWFEKKTRQDSWGRGPGLALADAVRNTHPDFALNIWRKHVEGLIETVNVKAYREAGAFLRKAKEVYETVGKVPEWSAYVRNLRIENRRRPRMIEVLDALEKKPIIRS